MKSKFWPILLGALAAGILAPPMSHTTAWHKVEAADRPALLFMAGAPNHDELWIASFGGDNIQRRRVIESDYLTVDRLGNAAFLVTARERNRAGLKPFIVSEEVFLFDFDRGTSTLLAVPRNTRLLAADPQRQRAMLISTHFGEDRMELFELDLESHVLRTAHSFAPSRFGGEGLRRPVAVKLAPGFERLAYVNRLDDSPVPASTATYALRVLDLEATTTATLDASVLVQISTASSFGVGIPPFEWIDREQVIYQDVVPTPESLPGLERAEHILKVARVGRGAIGECLRVRQPLSLNGGSLKRDVPTGVVVYNDAWEVDVAAGRLKPRYAPYAVVENHESRRVQVLRDDQVLYDAVGGVVDSCLSPSRHHFAWVGRTRLTELDAELHVQVDGHPGPIKLVEGPYLPTRPLAWIE